MDLKDQITADMKQALKNKESVRLRVLRSLKASLMEKEISERKGGEADLTNEQVLAVLVKAAKQRKESIEQFRNGGRDELAATEEEELAIIQSYLPDMMPEEDVREAVQEAIKELGAESMADMGKVMGVMMSRLKGRAEGSLISSIVKEELS